MTINKEKNLTNNYNEYFSKKLRSPEFCREYINTAIDEIGAPCLCSLDVLTTLNTCINDTFYIHRRVDTFIEKFQQVPIGVIFDFQIMRNYLLIVWFLFSS